MRVTDIQSLSPAITVGNTWKSGYQTTFNDTPIFSIHQRDASADSATIRLRYQLANPSEEFKGFSIKGQAAVIENVVSGSLIGSVDIRVSLGGDKEFEIQYGDKPLYIAKTHRCDSPKSAITGVSLASKSDWKGHSGRGDYGYRDPLLDVLIPEGSIVDPDKIIWIKQLLDGFTGRHISIVEDVSKLLSPSPIKASMAVLDVVRRALRQFQEYCRYKQESFIDLTDNTYKFDYTYPEYFLGETSFLEVVPVQIAVVGNKNCSFAANYWEYREPYFYMSAGTTRVKAFCEWPVFADRGPDGLFTEDSHIYGMTKIERDVFINEFDCMMLKTIKNKTHLIELPFSINFINVDTEIMELQSKIEEQQSACSDFTYSWE